MRVGTEVGAGEFTALGKGEFGLCLAGLGAQQGGGVARDAGELAELPGEQDGVAIGAFAQAAGVAGDGDEQAVGQGARNEGGEEFG